MSVAQNCKLFGGPWFPSFIHSLTHRTHVFRASCPALRPTPEKAEGEPSFDHKPRDVNLAKTTCWEFIGKESILNLKSGKNCKSNSILSLSQQFSRCGPQVLGGLQGPGCQNYFHSNGLFIIKKTFLPFSLCGHLQRQWWPR